MIPLVMRRGGVRDDGAGEEEEDVEFELGAEGDGEPEGVGGVGGFGGVGDGEAEAGDAGAEEGADGEGNVAGHGGVDEDGLEGLGVDPRVTLPAEVILIAGTEGDVEAVATIDGGAADEGVGVVGLDFGGERKKAGADAVFGVVGNEILAHVFDEVEVHGVVVIGGEIVVGRGCGVLLLLGVLRLEVGVVEVLPLVEELAVEREELLLRALVGGGDAEVGDLFALGGLAFARERASVLDVDVVRAGGLGAILIRGDTLHDVVGGGLLGTRGGGHDREKQKGGETHAREYVSGARKFRFRSRQVGGSGNQLWIRQDLRRAFTVCSTSVERVFTNGG
jgi:hypothetical protein